MGQSKKTTELNKSQEKLNRAWHFLTNSDHIEAQAFVKRENLVAVVQKLPILKKIPKTDQPAQETRAVLPKPKLQKHPNTDQQPIMNTARQLEQVKNIIEEVFQNTTDEQLL